MVISSKPSLDALPSGSEGGILYSVHIGVKAVYEKSCFFLANYYLIQVDRAYAR
jgi:hypothetical protein